MGLSDGQVMYANMGDDITWYCLSCKVVVKKTVDNVGKLSKKCLELENNASCLQEGLKTLKNEQSESFKIVGEKIVNMLFLK